MLAGGGRFHKNPIREKWMKMTPEERKEFIRNHHHFHHGFGDGFFKEEQSGEKD